MPPDDRLPARIQRGDGFCRDGAEPLRDSLRAEIVRRDERNEPCDGSMLVRPLPYCRGSFGRVAAAPVRPEQGPPELGLRMTSCVGPGRGRPVARVEDHEAGLTD